MTPPRQRKTCDRPATLLAVLVERDNLRTLCTLRRRCQSRCSTQLVSVYRRLRNLLKPHPQALDELEQALAPP